MICEKLERNKLPPDSTNCGGKSNRGHNQHESRGVMYVADMLYSRAFLIARCIPRGSDPSGCRLENTSSAVERESIRPTQRLHLVLVRPWLCSRRVLQVQSHSFMGRGTERFLPHSLVSITDDAYMHRGLGQR